MKNLIVFLLGLCILGMTACTKKADIESDTEAISSLTKEILRSWNEGDYEGYMALIDDDAIFMPPNASAITGIDALRSLYRVSFDQLTFDITISTEEIHVCDDWAFTRETWIGSMTPKNGGEPIRPNNKVIGIYRKQSDGSWKLWRAIYNSNLDPLAK